MFQIVKTVTYTLVSFASLSQPEQDLLRAAQNVRSNAQAPYSHFHVGVAVLSQKGTIHSGCNVERCSYSQTSHAEQNAIDNMVASHGPTKIEMVALVAAPEGTDVCLKGTGNEVLPTTIDNVPLPCGHCLQIIWENCFNDGTVKILSLIQNGVVLVTTINDLFPARFGPAQLNIHYGE